MNAVGMRIYHKIKKVFLRLILIFIISELILQGTVFLYKIYYLSLRKPAGYFDDNAFRIICVGESTTYGWPVHGNGYPEQLERLLNQHMPSRQFEVYNLGVCAITSREVAWHFNKNIMDYQPHLVIILLGNNVNNSLKLHYPSNNVLIWAVNQFYRLKTVKLFVFLCEISEGALNKTLQVYRIYSDIYLTNHNPASSLSLAREEQRSNLEYIINIALSNKCKVLISNYFDSGANDFLRTFSAVHNIPFCDNERIFKEYRGAASDLISADGWHPNSKGYLFMAQNLYVGLIRHNLLASNYPGIRKAKEIAE
jgi:lysophospholipase L1-like esterase